MEQQATTNPAWLGAQVPGMAPGFHYIKPNLFPFYQMRNQYNPQYGVYSPGSPNFRTWDNPAGQQMIGVRNMGQTIFGRNAVDSPFGQRMLNRASSGGMFQLPYDQSVYGMQQQGFIPPDMTRQQYNQAMRGVAQNARAAGRPLIAYYNPTLMNPQPGLLAT
jgi:hypothetical protein